MALIEFSKHGQKVRRNPFNDAHIEVDLKIRFPRRFQDGWLRVQKVRPKCDHGDALVPGFALIAVGDERLPMPFLNAGFPALLERLRTAPRPLPLTFRRVLLDDEFAPAGDLSSPTAPAAADAAAAAAAPEEAAPARAAAPPKDESWEVAPKDESCPKDESWECDLCGKRKTLHRMPGPDGPDTLCNACGTRFARGQSSALALDATGDGDGAFAVGDGWECDLCGRGGVDEAQRRDGPDGPGTVCEPCGSRFAKGRRVLEDSEETKEEAPRPRGGSADSLDSGGGGPPPEPEAPSPQLDLDVAWTTADAPAVAEPVEGETSFRDGEDVAGVDPFAAAFAAADRNEEEEPGAAAAAPAEPGEPGAAEPAEPGAAEPEAPGAAPAPEPGAGPGPEPEAAADDAEVAAALAAAAAAPPPPGAPSPEPPATSGSPSPQNRPRELAAEDPRSSQAWTPVADGASSPKPDGADSDDDDAPDWLRGGDDTATPPPAAVDFDAPLVEDVAHGAAAGEVLFGAGAGLDGGGDFESLFHRAAAVETERDVAGSIAAALSETAPPVNYGKFASDDDASDAAASPRRNRGGSRDDRDASPPPIATYVNPPAAAAAGGDAPPPAVEELLNLAKSFRDYARTSAAADGGGAPTDIASSLRASAWRKEVSLETPGAAAAAPPPPASGAPPAPGGPGGQDNLDFFVWLSGENPSAPPRP